MADYHVRVEETLAITADSPEDALAQVQERLGLVDDLVEPEDGDWSDWNFAEQRIIYCYVIRPNQLVGRDQAHKAFRRPAPVDSGQSRNDAGTE